MEVTESVLHNSQNRPLQFDPAQITPDDVRGLSLGQVTEQFGTPGLYVRTLDTLERTGFGDDELVQNSLRLGLMLHANDFRTNGHYTDHLMRVMLHVIEDFGIRERHIIAAAPLHDSFEDHPRDLVLALTGEKPATLQEARQLGREALIRWTNEAVVNLIETVTNPQVPEGADKLEVYTMHTADIVFHSPDGRVLKLADFDDNAAGNHATLGERQQRLDRKYLQQWRIHLMGMYLPDSLITGEHRRHAHDMLWRGYLRAMGRLGLTELTSPQQLLSAETAAHSHDYFK